MACANFDYRSATYVGRLNRIIEEKKKAEAQAESEAKANKIGFEPSITQEDANCLGPVSK